jgi:RNA polymerase sigma-70 factor (ECF subfamily)
LGPTRSQSPAPTGAQETPPAQPAVVARPAKPEDDLELVRGALARRGEAVQALAQRLTCVPRILAALNRRRGGVLGVHDLEDLAQDSLVRVWQKLDTYRGHVGLEFWVHRFCFLEFQNRLRGRGRFPSMTSVPTEPIQASGEDAGESAALDDEMRRLEQGLSALDPDLECVVRAKALERKSFEQIGAELDIPPATAKSRYYRGLSELKRALERGGGRP